MFENQLNRLITSIKTIFQYTNKYISAYYDSSSTAYEIVNVTALRSDFTQPKTDFNDYDDDFDYAQADTGSTLTIVSSDNADVHNIQINGLDINKDPISEIITLTGLTDVITTNIFTRLNSIVPFDVSIGDITVSALGFQWGKLKAGETNLYPGRYAIPRGYTFVPKTSYFYGDKSGEYHIRIYQRTPAVDLAYETITIFLYRNTGQLKLYPTSTQGPADIYLSVVKLSGNGSLACSGIFNGLLFDDSQMSTL
jgi:hypothetical protein